MLTPAEAQKAYETRLEDTAKAIADYVLFDVEKQLRDGRTCFFKCQIRAPRRGERLLPKLSRESLNLAQDRIKSILESAGWYVDSIAWYKTWFSKIDESFFQIVMWAK